MASQLFFYALRPLFIRPKSPRMWEFYNLAACLAFDAALLLCPGFGPRAMAYLAASAVFGGGLHPAAGHFISEHYVFVEGQARILFFPARRSPPRPAHEWQSAGASAWTGLGAENERRALCPCRLAGDVLLLRAVELGHLHRRLPRAFRPQRQRRSSLQGRLTSRLQ